MDGTVLGREIETASVSSFVERLRHGPAVSVISGDPGMGKTTLWRLGVRRGHESSYHVLTTRPVAAEAKLAFAGLTDLLCSVSDETMQSLPEPQRRALTTATLREPVDHGQSDPRAVAAATVSVLRSLCRERPVLVAIDDLQWLDPATIRTVESVARRLSDECIGFLVTERADADAPRSLQLERAMAPERFYRVAMTAMDPQSLRRLVERRLDRALPMNTHRRLQEIARGNPFFTLELASALGLGGAAGTTTFPLSPSLHEIVDERLAALQPRTRAVLVAATAVDHPTVGLVAAGTGLGTEVALVALEEAVADGVVELDEGTGRFRFAHPLYAAGIYARATPKRRREVHLALAEVMTSIELRARHSALGRSEPDADLARLLDRAAQHARARGAPDSAAVLAVQALRLTPAHETADRHRRTVTVARFRFHAGELEPARQMLQAVLLEQADTSTRAAARCLLGEIHLHQHGVGGARAIFAAAGAEASSDAEVGCRTEMHLAYLSVNTDHFEAAPWHARRALELSADVQDVGLRAESLAVFVIADYMTGRGLDKPRLEESLALEDPFHQVAMALRPTLIAGMLMLYEGRLTEAVAHLEACRRAADDRAEENDTPVVTATLAWCECWRGRLDEARRHGHEAIEVSRRLAAPDGEGLAAAYLCAVEAYGGDVTAAHAHADRAFELTAQTGSALPELFARWGLGLSALGQGDAAAAHATLQPLTALLEAHGLTEPVRAVHLADHIEAMTGLGDLDRADRLVDMLEECATRLGRRWAIVGVWRSRALLAAARGDLEVASVAAATARAWCDGLELRLEVARTLLVSGQIERRRKRPREANAMLTQALALFEEAGAAPWRLRAADELDRVAPHRREGLVLTPTERRVAELSRTGLTNRDVAARLNISPKTVEAHLSRTYAKLGIHSRAELGGFPLDG